MTDTPITDRAKLEAITHMGWVVPIGTCRDLERVANQLAEALRSADPNARLTALAAYKEMKKGGV